MAKHLEKENSSEKSVVVFEEVEEEKADAKTQGQAAQGDEAELPAGLSILFLVFGASVVRVSLELPLVVVGHQLAQGDYNKQSWEPKVIAKVQKCSRNLLMFGNN